MLEWGTRLYLGVYAVFSFGDSASPSTVYLERVLQQQRNSKTLVFLWAQVLHEDFVLVLILLKHSGYDGSNAFQRSVCQKV